MLLTISSSATYSVYNLEVLMEILHLMSTFLFMIGAVILRLPLLYGSIERLNESAATYLLHQLQDTSKAQELCDYQQRRPTHVRDVASVLLQLAQRHCKVGRLRVQYQTHHQFEIHATLGLLYYVVIKSGDE